MISWSSACAALSKGSEWGGRVSHGCALGTRGLFFVALLLLNSVGMMLYLKGMKKSGALVATVVNTATSTICTAIFGYALFGEALSLKWGLGAAMICIGVVLLSDAKARAGGSEGAAAAVAAAAAPLATAAAAEGAEAPAGPEPVSQRTRRRRTVEG